MPGPSSCEYTCKYCGTDIEAPKQASIECPFCHSIIYYGPPFGYWEGNVFIAQRAENEKVGRVIA